VLHELRVENLLLLERAELRLSAGLNVLTGETGTGKTLLAHALDVLLGGRARSGVVRAGASEAYVEGVFERPLALAPELADRIAADAEEVVLARRVWPDGRTRAYINGRSANLAEVRELGGRLLSFYGQHEHRKLMLGHVQLEILDAHCGNVQRVLRERLREAYDQVREIETRVDELRALAGARERELDLLAFELQEIEAADPSVEEQTELSAERDRLRHAEMLRAAAAEAAQALMPDGEGGMADGLAQAVAGLEQAAAIDASLHAASERLSGLFYEAQDLGSELRRYALAVEAPAGRLEAVEERLAMFARLERKHGGSITDVLRHAERCRARRHELEHADVALEAAQAELAEGRAELDGLAGQLSRARHAAAPKLAAAVRARLGELAMSEADFEVSLGPREGGIGPRGGDTVELTIAPNPGMPAGPLREIASGGELSRVMLALLSVTHGRSAARAEDPLLVFDEIDAGVGGHTARAVGEHLRNLAQDRQILCITHLPQIAALAARHFTIAKDTSVSPARTTVSALDGDALVGEIVRMLGAGAGDRAASQHARQLLRAA
jgi:DNA repair protein RecN (Recombination protein N)